MDEDYDVAGPSGHRLEDQAWYHGTISRLCSEKALKENEEFLVRDSISQKGEYVLTARWNEKTIHFQINSSREGGKRVFHFEEESFCSVVDLIGCYISHKRAITIASQCVISIPVVKINSESAVSEELEAAYMRVLRPNLYSTNNNRTLQQQVCLNQASRLQNLRPMSSISQHNLSSALYTEEKIPPPPPVLFHRPLPIPMRTREPSDDQDYCDMDYDAMETVLDASKKPKIPFTMSYSRDKKYSSSCHNLQRCVSPQQPKRMIELPKEKPSLPPRPTGLARKTVPAKTSLNPVEDDYDHVSGRLVGDIEKEKRLSEGSTSSTDSTSSSDGQDYDCINRNFRNSRDSGIYGTPSPPYDSQPNFSMVMLIKLKSALQTVPANVLAASITREDATILRMLPEHTNNLPGLNTMLLPCGSLLRSALIERSRVLMLSVVLTIVSGRESNCVRSWISVAHELLRIGNIFSFVNVMDAITCGMISGLRKIWDIVGMQSNSELEDLKSIHLLVKNRGKVPHCTVTIPFVQPVLEIMSSGDSQFMDHNTYAIELNSLFQWLDDARDWSSKAEKFGDELRFRLSACDASCASLSTVHLKKLLFDNTSFNFHSEHYNSIVKRIQKMVDDSL